MSLRSARSVRNTSPFHAITRSLLAGLLSFSLLGAGALTAQADDDVPAVADDGASAQEQANDDVPAVGDEEAPEQEQANDDVADVGSDAPARTTSSWELSHSAEPASGSVVEPGQQITYHLRAELLSGRPLLGEGAVVDLSQVLAHATLVEPLSRDLHLVGETLLWGVRHGINRPVSTSFSVIVDADAAGATLTSVASTTGEHGTCTQCTVSHTVAGEPSWDLTVTTNQEPGSTLATNAAIVSTMTAQNTSDVTVEGAQAVADLSGLGEHWDLGTLREGVSYDPQTNLLTWDVPDLEPGESASQRAQVQLRAPARGSEVALSFTAEGAGGQCVAGCNLTWHVSGYDASATATPPAGEVLPGDEITYTWHAQNISGGELTGAYVRSNLNHQNGAILASADLVEPLDDQLRMFGTTINWDIPDLGPGEEAQISFSVVVHDDAAVGADLWTQITPGDARQGGLRQTEAIRHTVGEPTWQLTYSAEPASGTTVQPGEEITYTLDATALAVRPVTNVAATVDLSEVLQHATIAEPLPFGLTLSGNELTWNVRHPVHRNNPASVSFDVIVNDDAEGATLTSTATPQRAGGVCTDCTVTHTVDVPAWELSVNPNHEPGSTLLTNAAVLPRMTVENTSSVPVSGAQVVADLSEMGVERYDVSQVPADAVYDTQTGLLTWSVPDLAPGESVTERFQVRLVPSSRGAEVSMDFTTVGAGGQCVAGCDLAWHVSGFDASASADVPAGVVTPGTEITYTWSVQNVSGGELTGAHLRSNLRDWNTPLLESADLVEPLDDQLRMIGGVLNWDIPDLGPGEQAEVSFSVVVRADAADGAAMRMGISPGTARHGGSAVTDPIVHNVGVPAWEVSARAADVRGITIPDGSSLRPNGQLNYHLSAVNTSGVPITDGSVVADVSGLTPYANIEALGAGAVFDAEAGTVTWSVPQLAPGEDAAVSFRANLRFADAPGAVLPFSVDVIGAGGECVSGCELEHYATGFQASMSTDPGAGEVGPGEEITYTWQIENTSHAPISGATMTAQLREVFEHADLLEPLAEGLRLVSIVGPTLMRWDVPDLDPHETVEVSFTVVVHPDAEPGAEFGTRITAGANSFGITYGQREVTHTVGVPAWEVTARAADVRGITIPDGSSLQPNGQLNYHLSATNTSGVTVRDGSVVADVSGLTPYANIEALGAGAVFDAEAGTVTWSVPQLAPGADASVSFRANLRLADAPGAVLPLSISVIGAGGECVSGCELEHYTTAIQASVHAEPVAGEIRPGGAITYTWQVENTSRAHVSGAYVRAQMSGILDHARIVELPEGIDFAFGTVLNWDVPDLAPGQSAQVSFVVVVDEDTEPGSELAMSITAGPNALGVSYDAQSVSHTVAVAMSPPSIPPILAILLGLAKFIFGLLIWLF